MEELKDNEIKDTSGNGYDATVTGAKLTDGPNGKQLTFDGNGYIEAEHKALKWPYTAVFDLTIDENQTGDIVLFEEQMPEQECVKVDGNTTGQEKRVIVLKEQADGTYRLTYSRENFNFEHNFTFKKGQPYRIAFASDESKPTGGEYDKWNQPNTLYVNGKLVSTLQGPSKPADFNGTWWVDSPSMNMPLEKIGQNLVGSIDNFQLYNRLLTEEEIAELGGFEGEEPEPGNDNLALNKPTTASSAKLSSQEAKYATDGNKDTRWGSNYNSSVNDPFDKVEWLCIDLQDTYSLGNVKLYWQDAYAKGYTVQVSDGGENFKDVLKITDGNGGEDILDLAGVSGRYIRIYCTEAVPSNDSWKWNYGYSLFEVEVYEHVSEDYTVTVDVDGTQSQIKVSKDEGKLGDKMPETPVKDGYVFKEWNTKPDGTGEVVTADTPITGDITIYAIFEKVAPVDKIALKIALDLANAITDKDLKDVIPAVANEFKAARDKANEVYNDASASQVEVNNAFDRLAKAMHMLDFKQGDKTALKAFIDKVTGLDSSKYTESTWTAFDKELDEANAVYNDENAMQEEVNTAYSELVTAFLNLRLIPDKSLLEELINQANGLNSTNYTKASFDGLTKALNEAKVVFENPNASQVEVDNAKDVLAKALAGLQTVTTDNTVKTPVDNGDATSVKTGDNSLVGMFAGLALLSVAGYTVLRKKED